MRQLTVPVTLKGADLSGDASRLRRPVDDRRNADDVLAGVAVVLPPLADASRSQPHDPLGVKNSGCDLLEEADMALRHAPIPLFRAVLHLGGDQDVAGLADDDLASRPAACCRSGSPTRRPLRRACPSRPPNVELHEHPALPVRNRSLGIRDVGARRLAHLLLDRAGRPQERQLEMVTVQHARHHHFNSPVTLACSDDERRALVMRRSHE